MAVLGLFWPCVSQGSPGHRGVDLLHQEGFAGIFALRSTVFDIRFTETRPLSSDVQDRTGSRSAG